MYALPPLPQEVVTRPGDQLEMGSCQVFRSGLADQEGMGSLAAILGDAPILAADFSDDPTGLARLNEMGALIALNSMSRAPRGVSGVLFTSDGAPARSFVASVTNDRGYQSHGGQAGYGEDGDDGDHPSHPDEDDLPGYNDYLDLVDAAVS